MKAQRSTRRNGRPAGRLFLGALCSALALGAAAPAVAADAPFVATTSAAGEADDDGTWETGLALEQARRGERRWRLGLEYNLDPQTSFELEATRGEGTQGLSLGAKRLFNSFAHDDWAWGLAVEVGAAKARGGRWKAGGVELALPLSWQVAKPLLLHATLGVEKARGEEAERVAAVAAEWSPLARVTLFAEAGREGEATLAHGGVRWWIRRERLALDVSALRRSEDGRVERAWRIGVSLQDL